MDMQVEYNHPFSSPGFAGQGYDSSPVVTPGGKRKRDQVVWSDAQDGAFGASGSGQVYDEGSAAKVSQSVMKSVGKVLPCQSLVAKQTD